MDGWLLELGTEINISNSHIKINRECLLNFTNLGKINYL